MTRIAQRCPVCGGHLDLVLNEYVSRCVCVDCNTVFKVRLKLTKLFSGLEKKSRTEKKVKEEE